MGVSVGLPVDGVWNGGSDLQAGVEIYYWEHPLILAHFGSQNDPLLGPQFHPSCGQLAAPNLFAHRELGPSFKLYTQEKILEYASYPVSHWPCPDRASHAWE